MSEENNNFRELKQLLRLKQHEVPPPGYFNHFSGDVISRIRAGETGAPEGVLARFESGSFMGGLLQLFQAKPGVIGGFATSLCLLLLFSVVMAERPDGTFPGGMSDMQSGQGVSSPLAMGGSLLPAGDSGITVSTNPIVSLQPSVALFSSSQQNPLFQPAAFVTPGQ
jgi:hypothetical protein